LVASTTPGQARCRASHSPITAPGVEAPMTKPPSCSRMPEMPGIFLISTMRSGLVLPERSWTSRSVPPDLHAPRGFGQNTHGLLDGRRRYITEHDLGVSV
jgi:hypothetical protein